MYWLATWIFIAGHVFSICEINQPILSYGDSEGNLTITVVGIGDCHPEVFLRKVPSQDWDHIEPIESREYTFKDLDYSRTSFVFEFEVEAGTYQWWCETDKTMLGPYFIHSRGMNDSAKFVWISDMDISDNSLPTRNSLLAIDWSKWDGLLYSGDLAYDIQDDRGLNGDRYFAFMGSVHASTPFLVVAGNHENSDNGRLLNYRLAMPNGKRYENNFFWKKKGPLFLLFVNFDYLLTWEGDSLVNITQYMDSILRNASDSTWKVVITHRPINCGHLTTKDCSRNLFYLKPFDDLFRKHKVDVYLQAHEHFYERLVVLDKKLGILPDLGASFESGISYADIKEPIQILNGCAGNEEFFPETVEVTRLSQKSLVGQACFSEVIATKAALEITVRRSKDGSLFDKVVISKSGATSWVVYVLWCLVFAVIIIGGFLLNKPKTDSKKDASNPLDVDSGQQRKLIEM